MARKDFTAVASPNTRVSQYVLRDRISRYFHVLQRNYQAMPGNENGAVFDISISEKIDRAESTLKYSIDGPSLYMDVLAEFKEGTQPVITIHDEKGKQSVVKDPRSMAVVKGPVEDFMAAQTKRLPKDVAELEAQIRSIQQFIDANAAAPKIARLQVV